MEAKEDLVKGSGVNWFGMLSVNSSYSRGKKDLLASHQHLLPSRQVLSLWENHRTKPTSTKDDRQFANDPAVLHDATTCNVRLPNLLLQNHSLIWDPEHNSLHTEKNKHDSSFVKVKVLQKLKQNSVIRNKALFIPSKSNSKDFFSTQSNDLTPLILATSLQKAGDSFASDSGERNENNQR